MNEEKKRFYEKQIELANELEGLLSSRAWKEVEQKITYEESEAHRLWLEGKNLSTERILTLRGEARSWAKLRKILANLLKKREAAIIALRQED